jgi:P4 family phage/plasmid primase-like protien
MSDLNQVSAIRPRHIDLEIVSSYQTPNSPEVSLPNSLQQRGLWEIAVQVGVTEYPWVDRMGHLTGGYAVPLHDEAGQALPLADGRPAQHWKNQDSSADPKYRFGYRNSRSGQTKPDGCDIYFPGYNIQDEVADAEGVLIVACGEPDTWTFLACGQRNVICFFGEMSIPSDLVATLRRWGVSQVLYYPDRDNTGTNAYARLSQVLAGSGIQLTAYELPEEVQGQPVKDINDLFCAFDCDPQAFHAMLVDLPILQPELSEKPNGLSKPTVRLVPRSSAPKQRYTDLPAGYIAAIEQEVGVKRYKPDGWSNYVPCPFSTHEDDARRPKASWHRDMHVLHCFKCNITYLAIDVGPELGLDWHDYVEPPARASQPLTGGVPNGSPVSTNTVDEAVVVRHRAPTDDEVGAQLIQQWDGDYAYFRDSWYHYEAGVWRLAHNIGLPIWDMMIAAKSLRYTPTKTKQQSVEDYLRKQLAIADGQIDHQDHLFNLVNGVYNLETGQLEPHQREFYLTTQVDYAFDPDAECPLWLRCLDQWLTTPAGEPDLEMHQVLQEYFGYSFTTDTSFEASLLLHGLAGGGKSQVLKTAQGLLGDACISLNLGGLERNSYQLADVVGKRLVICTEFRSGVVLAEDIFKQLVSGEEMAVRQIYHSTIHFRPIAKVLMAANERPQNLDRSGGVYRRLLNLPFHRTIPEEERNPHLGALLHSQRAGIFNWSMIGLARLLHNQHFTRSAQASVQVQEYRAQNDTEAAFLDDPEWFSRNPEGKVKANDLYLVYAAWCERYGHRAKSNTLLAADWLRLGLHKFKRSDGNYYVGGDLMPLAVNQLTRRWNR